MAAPFDPASNPPLATPSPAPPYAGWSHGSTSAYRAPVLPPWLGVGALLVLAGGALVCAGFLIEAAGTAAYASGTTPSAIDGYFASIEWSSVVIGLGVLVAVVGWLLHQKVAYRQSAR